MPDRKVAVFLLGGTIDSVGASSLDHAWYTEARQRLTPSDLFDSLPELAGLAQVEVHADDRVPSYVMTSADWLALARRVSERLADPRISGAVIAHGTNTLEETAFFLDLVLAVRKPVVVTGALRPARSVGSDGPINLLRSFQVALSDESRDRGVLVVLDDTIHAARHVIKTTTFRTHAFGDRDAGPFGYIEADGTVRFAWPGAPVDLVRVDLERLGSDLPRVDVVVSHVDADGTHIDASCRAGARALVIAGTGAGRPTGLQHEAAKVAVASGVRVCLATRVPGGRVLRSPGMIADGFLTAGSLPAWKAKVVLQIAVAADLPADEVQQWLDLV